MACLCWHRGEKIYSSNPFADLTLEGSGWSATSSGCFTTGKVAEPVIQEAGLALGLVCLGTESLASNRLSVQPFASRYTILPQPHLYD